MTNTTLRQWDIVKVRINSEDKDEHHAVIISPKEYSESDKAHRLNVLYCTSKRPAIPAQEDEVLLNGADGLDRLTLVCCSFMYVIPRARISSITGRVALARQQAIRRKITAAFRL
ncbi:hypothetical protein Ga0100231_005405 [Opitutaceae bacterium TAV4]|uniref:type II toxin-antitoxin system PemK/MazF family toxin n=1 Tax=Geminisphaera colitermitum TaxID=1148786 RepID=UPI0001964E0B|nr:type II toxin-antitoxin system PemK/MazF family toxin [Geminisphaera colitermitum]RRJ97891.1 hypothetical protein Ga0100231_005405 [Opitutaceae bacterium TAV4]RRK02600.1 hypothetical protein Ga0100230_005655 [Opitutaceae bacterium TAV3]